MTRAPTALETLTQSRNRSSSKAHVVTDDTASSVTTRLPLLTISRPARPLSARYAFTQTGGARLSSDRKKRSLGKR